METFDVYIGTDDEFTAAFKQIDPSGTVTPYDLSNANRVILTLVGGGPSGADLDIDSSALDPGVIVDYTSAPTSGQITFRLGDTLNIQPGEWDARVVAYSTGQPGGFVLAHESAEKAAKLRVRVHTV